MVISISKIGKAATFLANARSSFKKFDLLEFIISSDASIHVQEMQVR